MLLLLTMTMMLMNVSVIRHPVEVRGDDGSSPAHRALSVCLASNQRRISSFIPDSFWDRETPQRNGDD